MRTKKAQIELIYKEWDSDKEEYVAKEGFQMHGYNFENDSVEEIKDIAVRIISDMLNGNREEFKLLCCEESRSVPQSETTQPFTVSPTRLKGRLRKSIKLKGQA